MRRRLFWMFFALLAIAMVVFLSYSVITKWQIYSKGSIVEVTITSLPNATTTNGNVKFEYEGTIYAKSMDGNTSRMYHPGDKLKLKYLKGYSRIFLFPDENPLPWGVAVIAMISFFGIACLYYAFKKDPPPIQAFGRKLD
jgi:hypothetical protein